MRIIIMNEKGALKPEIRPSSGIRAAAVPSGPLMFGLPETAEALRESGISCLACAALTVSDRTPKERIVLIAADRAGFKALSEASAESEQGEIPFSLLAEKASSVPFGSLLCAGLPDDGPIAAAVGAEERFAEASEKTPDRAEGGRRKRKSLDSLRKSLDETEKEMKSLSDLRDEAKTKALRNFSKRAAPPEGLSDEDRKAFEERLRRDEKESEEARKELPRIEGKIGRRRRKRDALLSEIKEIEAEEAERERLEAAADRNAKTASRIRRTDYAERKAKPYAAAFGKAFVALVPKDSEKAERTKALAEKIGISTALPSEEAENGFEFEIGNTNGEFFFFEDVLRKRRESEDAVLKLKEDALASLAVMIPDAERRAGLAEEALREAESLPDAERSAKAVEIIRKASRPENPSSVGIRAYGGKGCFSALPYALGLSPTNPSGAPKLGNPPDLSLLYTDEAGARKFEERAAEDGAVRVGRVENGAVVADEGAFFFPDDGAENVLPTVGDGKGRILAVSPKAGNLPGTVVRTIALPENAAVGEAADSVFRTLGLSVRIIGLPVPDFSKTADEAEAAEAAAKERLSAMEKEFPKETAAAELNAFSDRSERKRILLKCRLSGIRVLPPDLNRSDERYSAAEEGVLTGLSAVKGVEGQASAVVAARGSGYSGFADFIERCPASSGCVRALVKSGALDAFSPSRKGMLLAYERLRRRAERLRTLEARIEEKERISDGAEADEASLKSAARDREEAEAIRRMMREFRIPSEKKESPSEKAAMEASVLPISATGSILDEYDGAVSGAVGAGEARIGDKVKVLGIVSSVGFSGRSGSTFFTVSDKTGRLRAVMAGDAAAKCASSVRDGEAIVAFGSVREDKRYGGPILTVSYAAPPEAFRPQVVVAWDGEGERPRQGVAGGSEGPTGGRILYYDRRTGLLEVSDFFAGEIRKDGADVAETRVRLKLDAVRGR